MLNNFSNKAQEISYALMRIAIYVKRKDMRLRFESLAMEILEVTVAERKEDSLAPIMKVIELLKLAASIYEVETLNARLIIEQAEALVSAIKQVHFLGGAPPDLSNIFSKPIESGIPQNDIRQLFHNAANDNLPSSSGVANNFSPKLESAITRQVSEDIDSDNLVEADNQTKVSVQEPSGMISIASTIRQTAILNKVRMMTVRNDDGSLLGCRMKDLMAAFRDVSERTLRNDLQRLLARGSVERIGNGGPASFYVIK